MKKLLHKSLQLFLWFAMLGFVAPISVVAADCYVAGSFNGWNATATKMTQNGSQYELFKTFDADTQFKIVYNNNWYGYDAVKGGTDLVTSADGSNKNIQFNSTGCYGLFFKTNGELYITKRDDCPTAYSLWGFDILYQEGDTKKWASTKSSAEAWDGHFISTSGDNEVYDMGVVKRGTRFIGFRFYSNENGSTVDGANVIWKNISDEHNAIEGSNYGIWSSSGSQSGTHGGTDEVWHVTDRKNKFLGYDNGTYSFYLVFEVKADGKEKAMVRTITINYTIDEFELSANLNGPCYMGDAVKLTVAGGTAPYTWEQSVDQTTWTTISSASGIEYIHTVVEKSYFRVIDKEGKVTNIVELTPSIKCDSKHSITIFKEDFGTLSDIDARTSYSKQNVAVPGTTITYSASVPYKAETKSCAAMTDGGYYAVLANPRNAGCGTGVAQGVDNCNCYNSSERWYRITEDHTPDDENGGMLMYNCNDGTTKTDVLYECTIDGICANTYINFSAFVTCANTGRSGNIPIEAEFKLFDASSGAELSTSPVTNIGLNHEWKEISAMFNSKSATKVKIQLINKADAGQGNDLLFDDMTLSVCTPEANLACSDNVSVEKVIKPGDSETLYASILSGAISEPYYLWQYQSNRSNWISLGEPSQEQSSMEVTPEQSPTYYRVVVANTAQEALNIAKEGNPSVCGMFAITNTVTLYAAYVNLTATIEDNTICADGQDATTLAIKVANPSGTTLKDVQVKVDIPAQYINKVTAPSGASYANGLWNIDQIGVNEQKTLVLTLKSDVNLEELSKSVTLTTYVSKLASATWNSYDEASMKVSPLSVVVNALPSASFVAATSEVCADATELTNAQVTFTGASKYQLTYKVNNGTAITKTDLTSPYTIAEAVSADATIQLVSVTDANGCVGSIVGQTHSVTADKYPTIQNIAVPATICEGRTLSLATPVVTANGSTLGTTNWELNGATFTPSSTLSATQSGQSLKYTVAYTCGRQDPKTLSSNAVNITVDAKPSTAVAGVAQTQCNNGTFTLAATAPAVGEGTWTLIGGSGTIADASSATSQVTDVPVTGSATLQWTVSNGVCPATTSSVVLTNNDCTSLNITTGTAPVVCDGSKATFSFTVKNGSPVATTNVTSTITLGAGLSDATITPNKGTVSGSTWIIPSMASGEEAVLTIVANATTSAATATVVVNKASEVAVSGVQASQSAIVNALPSASFVAATSEVCADATELTNAQVTFTGASKYQLTYKVNNGTAITKTDLTSPYTIAEAVSADATIQLVSVKDANGCVGTITGQTHSVTADYYPTIQDITKPATICEGIALSLTVPTVEANGSTLGTANWVLNGATFNSSSTLSATQNNQELKYAVAYTCGRQTTKTVSSNVVNITVDAKPSAAVAGVAQTQCNNGTFTLAATAPAVGEGTWTLIGGSGTIADASSATSQVTDVPVTGSATLQWTVSNGVCPATTSSVVLTNNDCTSLNITTGTAPVVCDGSKATFSFTVKNGSPVATTNVTSTITLGAGLSDATITPNKGTVSGSTWIIPSMASGEEAVLTIVANATTSAATATVVVNKASEVAVSGVQASQSATVNALPTAAFQSNSSTICIDPQDKELTNIAVNFTGAAPFELTYVDSKGSTYVENNFPLSATLLNADLDEDEAYTLVSVTDANGCVGTVTGQSHQVATKKHATLGELIAPAAVCDGSTLNVTAPSVINNNGAVVSNAKWFLNSSEFATSTAVTYDAHNGKELYYQITSSCNGIERNIPSNTVNVTVYQTPELALELKDPNGNVVTESKINCAVPYLNAILSGAESYTWNDGSTENPRKLGKKGQATIYTVTGATAAGCPSEPLTLTVTEDFATPDVSIALPTLGAADEPYIDNKTLTCNLASIVLTASSSKTVTYTWNDALATQGSTLTVTDKGEYQVTAVSADNGCSSTAVQSIGINKTKPALSVATTDNSTIINCIRTAITMDPSVSNADALGGEVSYTWYKDDALFAETEATEAGLYKVVAVGKNGCPNEVSLNITADTDTLAMDLTATVATITCAHPVSVLKTTLTDLKEVSLLWNNGKTSDTIQVREGGVYSVIATASNGCESKAEVELDQKTDLPKVEITPTDAIQLCRVNTLTASGATTYLWNTGSEAESIDVSEAGTYTVTGTNEYGCKKDTTLVLEDGKVIPVVKVESNHASITCTNPQVTFTATVTNANADHSYAYQWTINNESTVKGTKNTLSVADGKTYKVTVTDNDNFCVGNKTYNVSVKTDKPLVVQNAAWTAVCLPATINLEDAIDPVQTIADEVLFFEDELLTQPVTNTQIDMETYKVYYAQGMEVNGNGCKGVATPIAVNLKPATSAPLVKDYDECPEVGSKPLNQMVTSPYYKLTFYSQATGGAPIADAFDASKANTTTTYYVTNTNQGACESERVAFEVAIAGLVDIELEASATSLMVGGDPVVITVTSAGVDPDTYRWMANGKELQVEGNEYEANLYIDTKFEVAAFGRCNSESKEVAVEVLWPTAFTPYNNNGLNETFAKGLPVSIFNRFGIKVYEGADGWDGVMNKNMGANEMALPGVYYYAVPLPDGNVKKGTIEIVKF